MIKSAELENSAYEFEAKMPLRHAVPLGLQHVFAMFVGNLTPLLIITSACGLAGGEFADLQVSLLQNAMFVAGIVTLVQLYGLGPVGGKVPIIMGTSSGFLGVFNSVAATMGGGVTAYGAMMGASILGGLFESVLGVFLKPLRKLFPPVVTGTVVLSIGLSLISVGVNSFGGGNAAKDFGSVENLLLALFVLVVILFFKHWTKGFLSSSSILVGIVAGYLAAIVMGFVLPTTGVTAEGVEFTDFDSFKRYMRKPVKPTYDSGGGFATETAVAESPLYYENDTPIYRSQTEGATIEDDNGNVLCNFIWRNRSVVFWRTGPKADGYLPVTVYTQEAMSLARQKAKHIDMVFYGVYAVEVVAAAAYYLRKREK